jgi:hypothetical protein
VANDGNVVARGTSERTTVANLLLDVGDDSSLRDGAEGKDVADGERGVLAGVDELAGVHALVGDEGLGVKLVAVGVAEDDLGQRRAFANMLVCVSEVCDFEIVVGGWRFRTGVGSEDRAAALPLVANDTTLRLSVFLAPLRSIALVCAYSIPSYRLSGAEIVVRNRRRRRARSKAS